MSDKYGDIARSLGCEVTEEAESLRRALVKESARAAAADAEIERLRARIEELEAGRDEAREAARWLIVTLKQVTHGELTQACLNRWPWLES